jgi:ribosome-binding factor A
MLASNIRTLIAPAVLTCPPECGIVTITDVEVSKDFSYATVYISALRSPEKALEFLQKKSPELQRTLSALARKKIPMIRFRIDPRAERGSRLDQLLDVNPT